MNKNHFAVSWFLLALAACSGDIQGPAIDDDTPAPSSPDDNPSGGSGGGQKPGQSSAPPAVDDAPITTPGSGGGILDCPTVDYPGTTSATVKLSANFARNCGTCHGGSGEGKGPYPALPGKLSKSEFIDKVRAGANNMPSFTQALVDDRALEQDYDALVARTNASKPLVHPSLQWSATEVQAKREAGLALWRKPDKEGAACASCHSPDAIDLAVIGYGDDAIVRRATLHHPPDIAVQLVDFVHAQRRHFKITRPCSPKWRVLSPGGDVLPGDTVEQQDKALWDELVRRNIFVATGTVQTIEDADKAWDELAKLNMRRLPLGIPLARWTEDSFNGDEHKTINDWIPAVPRMATNDTWYAKTDAYLADPTVDRLRGLLADVATLTHDGGFAKQPFGDGDPSAVMTSKFHGVQIAAHYFRMALLNKPGWFESADSPPEVPSTRGEGTNSPFAGIGFAYQENHCYNVVQCPPGQFKALPPIAQMEFDASTASMPSGSGGLGFNAIMQKELTHPWWTLGGIWDASFSGGRSLVMHYWLENALPTGGSNFPHRTYHRPFMMGVAMVKRAVKLEQAKVAAGVPGELYGNIMMGYENTIGSTIGRTPENTRLISNMMRMLLLRQKRALSKGASTMNPSALLSGNGQGQWATGLEMAAKTPGANATLLTSTAALTREVLGLLAKAPVTPVTQGYQMPQ
ncbi:MAG: cytochrome c [Deltaproteobacteria bacterium]|nr:cytochrome c [Deltaproteobacteria bacterium]